MWNLFHQVVKRMSITAHHYSPHHLASATSVAQQNLSRLHTVISFAFTCHEPTSAVFFNLEKAYDTTWTWDYHILQQLFHAGITANLGAFLQARTFGVRVASSCFPYFPQHEGVPQYSLCPTVWRSFFLLRR